jgi:hypothetical protein
MDATAVRGRVHGMCARQALESEGEAITLGVELNASGELISLSGASPAPSAVRIAAATLAGSSDRTSLRERLAAAAGRRAVALVATWGKHRSENEVDDARE